MDVPLQGISSQSLELNKVIWLREKEGKIFLISEKKSTSFDLYIS